MLSAFELGHDAVEATKNIFFVKFKAKLITITR